MLAGSENFTVNDLMEVHSPEVPVTGLLTSTDQDPLPGTSVQAVQNPIPSTSVQAREDPIASLVQAGPIPSTSAQARQELTTPVSANRVQGSAGLTRSGQRKHQRMESFSMEMLLTDQVKLLRDQVDVFTEIKKLIADRNAIEKEKLELKKKKYNQ